MIFELFKPHVIFIEIFDDIKYHFTTPIQAYHYTEKVFAHRCQLSFGIYAFAFKDYNSFFSAYSRYKEGRI